MVHLNAGCNQPSLCSVESQSCGEQPSSNGDNRRPSGHYRAKRANLCCHVSAYVKWLQSEASNTQRPRESAIRTQWNAVQHDHVNGYFHRDLGHAAGRERACLSGLYRNRQYRRRSASVRQHGQPRLEHCGRSAWAGIRCEAAPAGGRRPNGGLVRCQRRWREAAQDWGRWELRLACGRHDFIAHWERASKRWRDDGVQQRRRAGDLLCPLRFWPFWAALCPALYFVGDCRLAAAQSAYQRLVRVLLFTVSFGAAWRYRLFWNVRRPRVGPTS